MPTWSLWSGYAQQVPAAYQHYASFGPVLMAGFLWMVFRLLAVLNEFERDQVSDRTRFALAHKRTKGEKTGGDVPFGYRARAGKLYPDAAEQKAVRLIRDLRINGASLRDICRALEAAGVARKNGSRSWHPQVVADILKRSEAA